MVHSTQLFALQAGFVPVQVLSSTHSTQRFFVMSQARVPVLPAQSLALWQEPEGASVPPSAGVPPIPLLPPTPPPLAPASPAPPLATAPAPPEPSLPATP